MFGVMGKLLSLAAVALLTTGALATDESPGIAARAKPAMEAPAAQDLTKLLHEFLAGASRNDPAVHEWFWADDLVYTSSSGRRVGKADILRDLRSAPPPVPDEPVTVYTAEEIRIQQYGETAIVAFRLVATTTSMEAAPEGEGPEARQYFNTGTFVRRGGKWQAVAWQATVIPETEE